MLKRLAGILFIVALTACSAKPQFELNDVTGAAFGRDFQLVDQNGQKRALADFKGKSLRNFLRTKEKEYLQQVLSAFGGDKEEAAKALKISLATLYRKLPEKQE